jgi:hypothetical protein
MEDAMDKQSPARNVDSQVATAVDKKCALMAQLQKLNGDMRELDQEEMLKVGGGLAQPSPIRCW